MDDLNLISQKFFGTKLDETFKQVLITNVEPIFLGIRGKGVVIRENKGFYPTSCLKISKKTFRLIKITPGNVILDVMKIINRQAEKVFFIGIVGSLNKQKAIGEIVIPREAVSFKNLVEPITFWDPNDHSSGKICQTDGLIQKREFYQYLIRQKVDLLIWSPMILQFLERKITRRADSLE